MADTITTMTMNIFVEIVVEPCPDPPTCELSMPHWEDPLDIARAVAARHNSQAPSRRSKAPSHRSKAPSRRTARSPSPMPWILASMTIKINITPHSMLHCHCQHYHKQQPHGVFPPRPSPLTSPSPTTHAMEHCHHRSESPRIPATPGQQLYFYAEVV